MYEWHISISKVNDDNEIDETHNHEGELSVNDVQRQLFYTGIVSLLIFVLFYWGVTWLIGAFSAICFLALAASIAMERKNKKKRDQPPITGIEKTTLEDHGDRPAHEHEGTGSLQGSL